MQRSGENGKVERMTELESFKNKVKFFDLHEKHKFNKDSRLLIAVPGLNLKTGNSDLTIEREIKEAKMFAEHVRNTIGAEVLILVELEKIDDVLGDKQVDCLIDLHELHSKQKDFIIEKIKKPNEPRHAKFLALYP